MTKEVLQALIDSNLKCIESCRKIGFEYVNKRNRAKTNQELANAEKEIKDIRNLEQEFLDKHIDYMLEMEKHND